MTSVNRVRDVNAFTLVELMIVVAIIGILAAIAIPNFRGYQLRAKRVELPKNLKAIKTAEISYQAEMDTFLTLVSSPRPVATCDSSRVPWIDLGNYTAVGWHPSGSVYGCYLTLASGLTAIRGQALSDIDNDGTVANYTFVVDISNPKSDFDVDMRSKINEF